MLDVLRVDEQFLHRIAYTGERKLFVVNIIKLDDCTDLASDKQLDIYSTEI
jgi:hypothetical protein